MNPDRLDRTQILALLAVLTGLLLPHAGRLPSWLLGALAILFGWRIWLIRTQGRMPPKWVLLPITFGLIVGVFIEFRTLLGRTGGIALFAALIGAKLLETRSRRDALLLVYLGYFLVVTNLLFDQTMALAAYLCAMVLIITTLLIGWHTLGGWTGQWRVAFKQARFAGVLMLQALPVMALLFVFFPRIEGPLWRLPQDRGSIRSGLADSMSPGSFSNMSKDDSVAFRVSFEGERPAQELLYWRGPVFLDYDGRTWTQSPPNATTSPRIEGGTQPPLRYAITLEPHQRPWLLALDMPATVPDEGRMSDQLQLVGRRQVSKRLRLELSAYLQYRAGVDEDEAMLARALVLPEEGNPRARQQAAAWRTLPPQARVDAVLQLFTGQGLQYTLAPPLYGSNAVDDFVYGGKQGFCEHFAGAFVFMMRAAGVPARVVGGYQGGEENGDYLIVRQADAHAWAEVWLEGQGWQRVDPTFAVAPSRIEEGLASAVNDSDLPYLLRLDNNLVKRAQLALDSMVNGWNQWVIGYTPERQRQVLKRLGITDLLSGKFVAVFLGSIGLCIALIAGWLLWRMRPPKPDAARQLWDSFCRRLAAYDLVPARAEGPRDFAQRAMARLPQRETEIQAILDCYLAARYGSGGGLEQLKQRVVGFGR
ncbi:hypothetical protein GCM10007907_39720 [Chitinimonas prasina]|uniref:Transglutaminase-like domain-containing protein n=1 Tax=Chitinimonas prasina TaxID=1434937 RepID=A0ABQ5YJI4_9NEIS|nr:DUF3488 and transglutaminase-like domain-containing protein [Chitinimonas prasina]GLR15182.1 hypothetical protein GCM10007907_39720 [Chitinimonas prasina]